MQSVTFTVWIEVSKTCSMTDEHHLETEKHVDMAFQSSAAFEVFFCAIPVSGVSVLCARGFMGGGDHIKPLLMASKINGKTWSVKPSALALVEQLLNMWQPEA